MLQTPSLVFITDQTHSSNWFQNYHLMQPVNLSLTVSVWLSHTNVPKLNKWEILYFD